MPNDPGPSSWLAGQYQKFMEGLELVGTPNAPRLARAQQPRAVRVEPAKQPRISIPHWDDIIRLGPRPTVSKEEYELHRHFERANLPSPLAPELQQAIADRRAMRDRIQNSAIPEYQRGVSTMMTVVDNVQDATLTLAVAGRITMTALGRFGSWLAPAVATFGRLALALNWLGLALQIFGVAYSLVCQGPRDAASQLRANALAGLAFTGLRKAIPRLNGIPTPFPAAGSKGRHGVAMFGVPSGREVANRRSSRWAKLLPSFGEALQIGQVAYDQLGYGLALGAIMGASSEAAYASARRARGETVEIRSPVVSHELERILRPVVAPLARGALWHRHLCSRTLLSSLLVFRDPESWPDDFYALAWVAYYSSLEPLMWDTEGVVWREPVIAHLRGAAWRPFEIHDPVTRALLEDAGLERDDPRWPVPGAPRELGLEQVLLELGPECGRALERWLDAEPLDPLRRFVAELAMATTERVWYWLEGATDYPGWTLSPTTAVWESLFLADRWPVLSDPPAAIQAAWAACEAYTRDTGQHAIPVEVLDRLWTEAGSPLLRLSSSSAELSPDYLAPWDPETGAPGDAGFGTSISEARARLEELLRQEGGTGPPA